MAYIITSGRKYAIWERSLWESVVYPSGAPPSLLVKALNKKCMGRFDFAQGSFRFAKDHNEEEPDNRKRLKGKGNAAAHRPGGLHQVHGLSILSKDWHVALRQ